MSETGSNGPGAAPSSDDRSLAIAAYAMQIVGPFTGGMSTFISLFIALARKDKVDPFLASHFRNQIRLFLIPVWALVICVVLAVASTVGLWFLGALGVVLVLVASLYSAIMAIVGIVRLNENRPAGKAFVPVAQA